MLLAQSLDQLLVSGLVAVFSQDAQAEAPHSVPEFVFHGRQVPGLPADHHRVFARADRRALRR